MKMLTDFLRRQGGAGCGIKFHHGGLVASDIRFGDVGIDFVHGGCVGPAADFHGDFLWHLQVIGQADEAVAQSVNTYIGKAVCLAHFLNGPAQAALSIAQHRAGGLTITLQSRGQLGDHDGHVSGGGGVFVLRLPGHFVAFIRHCCAGYSDKRRVWRDIAPIQRLNL